MATPLGKQFAKARIDAGLTASAVAQKAGLAAGVYSRIESGKLAAPSFAIVVRISRALGIELGQLAGPSAARASRGAAKDVRSLRGLEKTRKHLAAALAAVDALIAELRDDQA